MEKIRYRIEITSAYPWPEYNEYEGAVKFLLYGKKFIGHVILDRPDDWGKFKTGFYMAEVYFERSGNIQVESSPASPAIKNIRGGVEYELSGIIKKIDGEMAIIQSENEFELDIDHPPEKYNLQVGQSIKTKSLLKVVIMRDLNDIDVKTILAKKHRIRILKINQEVDESKFPKDLHIKFDGMIIHQDIWKQEDGYYSNLYKYFMENILNLNLCCFCKQGKIIKDYEKTLDKIITYNEYNDTTYYTEYKVYRCNHCRAGWTEFVRNFSYTEVSFP